MNPLSVIAPFPKFGLLRQMGSGLVVTEQVLTNNTKINSCDKVVPRAQDGFSLPYKSFKPKHFTLWMCARAWVGRYSERHMPSDRVRTLLEEFFFILRDLNWLTCSFATLSWRCECVSSQVWLHFNYKGCYAILPPYLVAMHSRFRTLHFLRKATCTEEQRRVARMAQRLRMSARNPDILGSIPRAGCKWFSIRRRNVSRFHLRIDSALEVKCCASNHIYVSGSPNPYFDKCGR